MRLLLLAILALPAASAAMPAPVRPLTVNAAHPCPPAPGLRMAGREARGFAVRRLGDEPPGTLVLTVWREIGGCPAPAVLREGIGSGPARSPSRPHP
jgi:hypothetical protein